MWPDDVDAVMAVEVTAYSHPWTRGNFADAIRAGYLSELRLQPEGLGLVGYWVAMPGVEELHLLNLTVSPPCQRAGHGRALLARLVQAARARRDRLLWLEVRQSNAPARALYRADGFEEVGVRRGYYPADRGREDAVVMRLDLGPPPMGPSTEGPHALD